MKYQPVLEIHIEQLKKAVWFLTKIRPARNYRHPQSLEKVASYIGHCFSQYGVSVEYQSFDVEQRSYTNVIGSYGIDKSERIIVGAHYDVCGDQPGADDNASAVAGLLEIARLISLHGASSPYRFDFVTYSLEEPPFFLTEDMGSYVHAKMLSDQHVRVRGMICLEMIGYFCSEQHSQTYPIGMMAPLYPTIGNFIAVVGTSEHGTLLKTIDEHLRLTTLPVESLSVPPHMATSLEFSDHLNYWKFGYDAVMVTDTAMYRNPHYHRASDTMQTLDFDKMGEVVKGVTWGLLNLSSHESICVRCS